MTIHQKLNDLYMLSWETFSATQEKGEKKRIWLNKLQFSKVIEQIEWRFLQSVKSLEILDYEMC